PGIDQCIRDYGGANFLRWHHPPFNVPQVLKIFDFRFYEHTAHLGGLHDGTSPRPGVFYHGVSEGFSGIDYRSVARDVTARLGRGAASAVASSPGPPRPARITSTRCRTRPGSFTKKNASPSVPAGWSVAPTTR